MLKNSPSTAKPEVTRWAWLLLRLLSRLDLDDSLVWTAWALAWIEHCSGGDPTAEGAPDAACAGLVGLRVDRYGARACGAPERQLEAFAEHVAHLVSAHSARTAPGALLAVACSPFSATSWVQGGDRAHVQTAARTIAALRPRAAAYLAWLRAWGLSGRPRRRVVAELPPRVIRWRSKKRSGQVLVPEWRGVIEEAVHTTAPAQVAALPAVVFRLGGHERRAPGPTLEQEVKGVLLEATHLPPTAALRLARALGLNVSDGWTLGDIQAALKPQVFSGCRS